MVGPPTSSKTLHIVKIARRARDNHGQPGKLCILDCEASGRCAATINQKECLFRRGFVWEWQLKGLIQSLADAVAFCQCLFSTLLGTVLRCDTDAQSAGFLEGQVVRDFDLYITFGGDSFTKSPVIVIQDIAYLSVSQSLSSVTSECTYHPERR